MYVLSRHIVHTMPRALGGEYSVVDVIRRSLPDDCGMNSYQRFRVAPYVLVFVERLGVSQIVNRK